MNKNNYNLDLYAGIDTLEVTTSTYLPKDSFAFITHDSSRRVTEDENAIPKYKYRYNPDNTLLDTSTLAGYQNALDYMLSATAVVNPVKTRIDFRFDDYKTDYGNTWKLNKLLLLLVAEAYKIKNRYQCIDMYTGDPLTLCIKNKYLEVEAYNKALQEPDGNIKSRLELRSKALYDTDCEGEKEVRELNKWFARLANATTTSIFDRLVVGLNDHLMLRYSEHKQNNEVSKASEFVFRYSDFIFTTKQLVDLFRRMGFKRPDKKAAEYRRSHKIEFFSMGDVRKYVLTIRDSAARFMENAENEKYPNAG